MVHTRMSGRTANAVRNRLRREGYIPVMVKPVYDKHFPGHYGMKMYSVTYKYSKLERAPRR